MTPMLILAALAAAAPLFARASEDLWGLAPCELCLWQRWPYWVAAGLALAAAFWPRGRRVLGGLAVLAVLASGAVGAFHVGVEQGWWPSPLPGCQALPATAGGGGGVEDMLRGLQAPPPKPCDAATYLIPGLPVSMAAMNILYALGLSALGLMFRREGAK